MAWERLVRVTRQGRLTIGHAGDAMSSGPGSCQRGGDDPERPARVQKETDEQREGERLTRRDARAMLLLEPA
jgi:hypothetical protein